MTLEDTTLDGMGIKEENPDSNSDSVKFTSTF